MSIERLTGKTVFSPCGTCIITNGGHDCEDKERCDPLIAYDRLAAYEDALTTADGVMSPEEVKQIVQKLHTLESENTGLRANSMIQEYIITGGRDPIRDDKIVKLIMENTALKSERDVLGKALEMMYADNTCYNPDGMGNPKYYIQQAKGAQK